MRALLLSLLFAAAAVSASAQTASLDVAGTWWTKDRRSRVEVSDCGNGTPCGRIVWINPAEGGTVDTRNRDPALRTRDLIGVRIMSGYGREGERWRGGRVYDPESGGTYTSHLQMRPDGKLTFQGCAGPICRTQIWERAS